MGKTFTNSPLDFFLDFIKDPRSQSNPISRGH